MFTQTDDLLEICMKHGLNPAHREEIYALVLHGRQPGVEVQNRLRHVANYRAALDEARAAVAAHAPVPAVVIPKYVSVPVTRFESLEF